MKRTQLIIILFLLLILFIFSYLISDTQHCKKGIACGNACISASKTCRIGSSHNPSSTTVVTPTIIQTGDLQNFDNAKFQLKIIYKNNPNQKEFYCGCDFSWIGRRGIVDLNSCGYSIRKNRERAERIEWEHVMPAENFGRQLLCWKKGGRKACKSDSVYNKMEGDMHNLQPAIGEVNGDRSNYGYGQFTTLFNQYGRCEIATDFTNHQFQPRDEIKGIIARTYLYMSDRYNVNLSKQDIQRMMAWDKLYPTTTWECQRNQLIKKIQGNDNKFITAQCE